MSYTPTAATPQGGLSAEQMDNLLAPIALYPDPLLAQVLPASTFVDQIDQAARWLRRRNNNTSGIDNQPWDVSVKSIGQYPQVVYMMSDKLDWTTALGQAYVNQSTVEEKSSLAPVGGPYWSQLIQLGVYLILVEENYGRVSYGVLKYKDRSVKVEFTQRLRQSVLSVLTELKRVERIAVEGVARSHNSASKCRKCDFYDVCDQRVV